jgi:hypothetical protein
MLSDFLRNYRQVYLAQRFIIFCLGFFITLNFHMCGDDPVKKKDNGVNLQTTLGPTDVQFNGEITLSGGLTTQKPKISRSTLSVSQLKLYCVTFSTPPIPGQAEIEDDGTYMLLMEEAACKMLGCFIFDKNSDTVISSVIFDSETGITSVPISAGEHQLDIAVYEDALVAIGTLEIGSMESDLPNNTISPFILNGDAWFFCDNNNTSNCEDRKIYLKLFSYKDNDQSKYGLATWRDEATYTAHGQTEGFVSENDFSDFRYIDENGNQVGGDLTKSFNGLTGESTFVHSSASMSAADITALFNSSIGTLNLDAAYETYFNTNTETNCIAFHNPPFPGYGWQAINLFLTDPGMGMDARVCWLLFVNEHVLKDTAYYEYMLPGYLHSENYNDSASFLSDSTANTKIKFIQASPFKTPIMSGREFLGPLKIYGNTLIAEVHYALDYKLPAVYNPEGEVCYITGTIRFTFSSDGDNNDIYPGRFTIIIRNTCSESETAETMSGDWVLGH